MSTGPKTSRWTISDSFERGTTSVGSYQSPPSSAAPAAADDLVAVRTCPLDEPLDPGEVIAVDERRDGGRVVARVAEHVLVGEAVEELEEALRDRLLDEQARAGEADLTGVVVLAGRLPRRRLEVAVGEHEERALAAELGGERDEVPRRATARSPARSRASR